MDFLNWVSSRMFQDKVQPSEPLKVQQYMDVLLREVQFLNASLGTQSTYNLELQGRIELDKHISLYGNLI